MVDEATVRRRVAECLIQKLQREVLEMSNQVNVPVTGPASPYDFEQSPVGHVDRTEQVRRVVELGLRYVYEFNRVQANLQLDIQAGQSDSALLRSNRLQVLQQTDQGGEG